MGVGRGWRQQPLVWAVASNSGRASWITNDFCCVVIRIRAEYGTLRPLRSEFTSVAAVPPPRDKARLCILRCVESVGGRHGAQRSKSGPHRVAGGMPDGATPRQRLKGQNRDTDET